MGVGRFNIYLISPYAVLVHHSKYALRKLFRNLHKGKLVKNIDQANGTGRYLRFFGYSANQFRNRNLLAAPDIQEETYHTRTSSCIGQTWNS